MKKIQGLTLDFQVNIKSHFCLKRLKEKHVINIGQARYMVPLDFGQTYFPEADLEILMLSVYVLAR